MKTKYIIEMPDGWKPENIAVNPGEPPHCAECPFVGAKADPRSDWYDDDLEDFCIPGQCPLATAKEAIEVKFDIDKETGLSVIDANGKFHFEGQDKYYAVAVDK